MNPLRLYAKWLIAVLLAAVPSQLLAQNTAFIYQGRLTDGGSPANGLYDFQFSLYEFVTQVGATITVEDQQVTNGLLTVRLDFGSDVFTGLDLSLEIGVRPGDSTGPYTTLSPQQELTPVPYAQYAWEAGYASTSVWGGLGDIPSGLADGVDDDLLASINCAGDQVLKWDDALLSWDCADDDTGTEDWSLAGNGGTVPGTHFLGTTDDTALQLHVNSARALRLEPHATSPNIIGGYSGNSVAPGAYGATISGGGETGNSNIVTDNHGVVGGGSDNVVGSSDGDPSTAAWSVISGGRYNSASGEVATIAGGGLNVASGSHATVGGGGDNQATDISATVAGGGTNRATGMYSTVGGGKHNWATGPYAVVAGGGGHENPQGNLADGWFAAIGGGTRNIASGNRATVPGGGGNFAGGDYSFAAGSTAVVRGPDDVGGGDTDGDEGTFVWADVSSGFFQSRGPNQFLIRAAGGVGIGTNDPDEQLHVAGNTKVDGSITSGNSITIDGTANTINSSGNLDLQTGGISRIYVDNTTGNVRIGSLLYGGKLTVLGDVHATSQITRDYGDGNDNPAAPLAYGFVHWHGGTGSITPNTSVRWNATEQYYEITITGETYTSYDYTTVVTLQGSTPGFVTAGDNGAGKLVVYTWDVSSTPTQRSFQFITYKP